MSGAGQAEQPEDQGDQADLETKLAELYELAIVSFRRGAYGYTLQLLSKISKLKPSYVDRENLRGSVAAALDRQQQEVVFSSARTKAEEALQQKRWDDIPGIIAGMHSRLEAENLALDDSQRR